MKTLIKLAALIAIVTLTTGCQPETKPEAPAITANIGAIVQTGNDFNFTVQATSAKTGYVFYDISIADDQAYAALANDNSLIGDNYSDLNNTILRFQCVYMSSMNTSTHRYYICKDQLFQPDWHHRLDLLLAKDSNITLALDLSVTDDITFSTYKTDTIHTPFVIGNITTPQ